MIWLTWRQHRIEVLVLGIMLALITAFLIYSSIAAYIAYYQVVQGTSVATCMQQHRQDALCQTLNSNFYMNFSVKNSSEHILHLALQPILLLILLLQALVAMFLGAPLVAGELERGTFRLVWTQSVTRLRWMVGKVGALMGITLLLFALISLLVMWWNGPFDRLGGGVEPWSFDFEGIAPLAYMAYALSLAIAAGTLLRKTVPAMVVTLVGYVAARIPIGTWARPYYVPPLSVTWDPYITTPKVLPGGQDWILFQNYVGSAGHPVPTNPFDTCGAGGPLPVGRGTTVWDGLVTACTHAHGWLYTATWQPAERFWLFQGIESAIFLGLAAALLALAFWWVRERIS